MNLAPGVLLAATCLTLAVPLLLWSFTAQPDTTRQRALANLKRGETDHAPADEGPVVGDDGLIGLARRLTPTASVRMLDRLLGRAGRPAAWPLERVLVVKLVSTAASVGVAALLLGGSATYTMMGLSGFVVAFVWFLPETLLYNTGIKRRGKMQLALPDTMDQLTIAVEAGLGFEAAMAHVSRNSHGPLADELLRTLQDIQVGQTRRAAYTALTDRTDVPDLRRFVRAIVQAEKHGVSIARVLETQADEMRIKRRQRAEEKAMQIPVKVVFPLILFILPALFIVLLGPAVINTLRTFGY